MRGKGDIGNTLNKKERELRGMESLLKIEKMKKTFFKKLKNDRKKKKKKKRAIPLSKVHGIKML